MELIRTGEYWNRGRRGLADALLERREEERMWERLKERNPEVLVSMGAGDINQFVGPLKEWCMRI